MFVRDGDGEPLVAKWWMGRDRRGIHQPGRRGWWREQAKRVLALGVEGIKADDGEGWYLPDDVRFANGTSGAQAAWGAG